VPRGHLLTSAGLRQPAARPAIGIDPHWLREQYQDRHRSLTDIAAETGIPIESLATTARKAGLRVRRGINGRAHPLAALGVRGSFFGSPPPAICARALGAVGRVTRGRARTAALGGCAFTPRPGIPGL
jgi:hypothetical protein